MTSRTPYIIGIAGATCSGKTYLAKSLEQKFRGMRRVIIQCDAYYRDLSALDPEEREQEKFRRPGRHRTRSPAPSRGNPG